MKCPKCKFKIIVGLEITEVYDGVIAWRCEKCKHVWARKGFEDLFDKWFQVLTPHRRKEKKGGKSMQNLR